MNEHTILIVSPDPQRAKLMVGCLAEAGFDTQMIPQEACTPQVMHQANPDMVILASDLLHQSASLTIVRTLRAAEQTDRLVIILASQEMQEADILSGLDAGADICLAEAFRPQLFVARVRSLLRRADSAHSVPKTSLT
jgi:DNA-binding response OmpR family regulator